MTESTERMKNKENYNKRQAGTEKNIGNKGSIRADILFLLAKTVILIIVVLLLFTVVFGVVRVRDMSMKPAIMEGDLVFFYRFQKDYSAGDLIALKENGETEIRRVVAVAGDTVDITDDGLYVNGNLQQESYIYTETRPYTEGISFPLTLSEGEVFVLGDKRDSAEDSRIYGAVDLTESLGKVMTLIRRRNF